MGRLGFTLPEVLLAILVLGVGLLGLASTTALVTRMIGNGHRAAVAATFAAQRLERLRTGACSGSAPEPGSENLMQGAVVMVSNRWSVAALGGRTWHVDLTTTYWTAGNGRRVVRFETSVAC